MSALAFLDTETTGLDPTRHEVWEVGLILRHSDESESEHRWQLPVDLGKADPMGLSVGRFYERRWRDAVEGPVTYSEEHHAALRAVEGDASTASAVVPADYMPRWADKFARLTWGAHLVGAVPSFDAAFLGPLLRRHGACPGWHYHLVDVEAMAAGALQEAPPWDSEDLSEQVGCPVDKFDRHTALGDARWAMAVYDAVVNAPMEAG